MSKKVYEMITNSIIEKLEEGTIPWKKPFNQDIAYNWKTQKAYRGINNLLLDGGEYATFKQIKEAGGTVKKGEKSHLVVFWKMVEKEDEENPGEMINIPVLRYYRVFRVGNQTKGIEEKQEHKAYNHNPIEEAENIIKNYKDKPKYTNVSGGAWYKPLIDTVNVPSKMDFENIHHYYSVLFHESIHSTGHTTRLNREGITKTNKFGSIQYSKEELVAEIGASMLCGVCGINNETIDNNAAYIQNWLQKLKNDNTFVVSAAQKAQKASDYIQGISF